MQPHAKKFREQVHALNLSHREQEVLALMGAGLGDEEIAARLAIAPSTVAAVLRSAMAALEVSSRSQAVARLAEIAG